ncbi:MAG: ROK family protein [Ruminococcaceae bacterium]|nr:ROK family protein [Oscillospiraceae bacterium]
MKYRIGVDIGGTSVKLAAVDSEYIVHDKLRFPTGEGCTSEFIINGIIENCKILMEKYDVEAIGVGSAGRVDSARGMVLRAGNLPFKNEPVVEKLVKALGVPAFIDNDGTCALIGEKTAGACKGCEDALIITIGTGIGGAILIGDRVVRGHNNRAGELGHFILDRNGVDCECGLRGCFERYASATALIEMTEKAVLESPDSIIADEAKKGINGKTAFDAKDRGCPVAISLLDEYGRVLADGLNSLIHIFQPQAIVLSGGVSNQGEGLMSLVRPHLFGECKVLITALKGDGGIIGASLLGTPHST